MLHLQTVSPSTLSLLRSLSNLPTLQGFSLAGGTSLALQIGHRISVDLDFFGTRTHSFDDVLLEMNEVGTVEILSRSNAIITLLLNGVKVDVVNYKYDLIKPLQLIDGLRLHSLEDISAMKLGAVTGRGKLRDFYDIYYLLSYFNLSEMLDFYEKKFPDGSRFLLLKSLIYFNDAEKDDSLQLFESVSWQKVKETILAEHGKL